MKSHKLMNFARVLFLLTLTMSLYGGLSLISTSATNAGQPIKTSADVPSGKPEASIDLASADGVDLVKGEWRYSDTKIVEVDFRGPGVDKQPSGPPTRTYDYAPHAGGADFDDSRWEVISPTTLDQRRGNGRLGFQLVSHQADNS